MSSSPHMIQVYQDEEGCVGEHAPFLPQRPSNEQARPRWVKDSCRRTRFRRLAIASGTFITLYLFFCTWVAYARNEIFDSYDGPDGVFPHPRWPFPKRPPHHPPPHPRHPPRPTVLGCKAVPVPSDEDSFSSVELKVTLPKWHVLVLEDHLLWGDVSVSKVDPDSDMTALSEEKNLTVGITVANRTFPHHPPPKSILGLEEEDVDKENKGFVLCALSFDPPRHHKCKHHHPPPPPPEEGEELALTAEGHPHPPPPHHPHPHPHPHFFPPPPHVLVAVLPAHNETYPRLPGPHGPPPPPPPPPGPPPHDGPEGPEDEDDEDIEATGRVPPLASVFSRAWRSTISFFFPMLPILSDSFPKHWTHPHPHHPPHGHPPPFIVTELTVSLPRHVPVKYGLPFRPLPRPWRRHH